MARPPEGPPERVSLSRLRRAGRALRSPGGIALVFAPAHVGLALATDLSPDEAYYLASGRFGAIPDHPPLTGWLAAALFGVRSLPLELRVRLPVLVLSAASTLLLAALATDQAARVQSIGGKADPRRAGRIAAVLANALALPAAGGFLLTPDAPAAIGFLAALAWASRAPRADQRRGPWALAVAAGALGKVSVLLAALIAIASQVRSSPPTCSGRLRSRPLLAHRPLLGPREPHTLVYLAALGALGLALGPRLRFQLVHALGPSAASLLTRAAAFGASTLGFLVLFGPPIVGCGVRALSTLTPVFPWTVTVFGAVLSASALLRGVPPEPNWWLPVGLPLLVAASVALSSRSPRAVLVRIGVSALPTLLAVGYLVLPVPRLPLARDPAARLHGWQGSNPPVQAPGIGGYGPSAEACAYHESCDEILCTINRLQNTTSPIE